MDKAKRAHSGRTPMTSSHSPAHKTRWVPPDGLRPLCRPARQKDAFAGKLVPQDPADKPAAELLARIRASRAVQPQNTRRSSA